MSFRIDGIGTALPAHRLTQEEAYELHATFCRLDERQARTLRALYRRSGIEGRHSVLLARTKGDLIARQTFYAPAVDECDHGPTTAARMAMYERLAPPLALTAARRALDAGRIAPDEITHLVTVSCTGFVSPGVDAALIEGMGLPRDVERTNVGFMGCHGALNGLRVARSFLLADPAAVPLVCAVELCTLHFSYGWDPDMIVANALFSDGAAAVVGRADGGERGGGTSGDEAGAERGWCVAATGTCLMEDSAEAMTWRIGDHGFRMTLSAQVPAAIEANLRPWLVGWLAEHGLGLDGIRSWAVHPGGPRILSAVERTLGLPGEATAAARSILSANGNMSSPTILFILDRMRRERAELPCVALAFGPGLAVEAALLVPSNGVR